MGTLFARVTQTDRRSPGDTRAAELLKALDSLAERRSLDAVVEPLQHAVRAVPLGGLRGVLQGRRLGHPLHPALVQVPVGAWLSSALLDGVPGCERAARTLVAVGVAAAVPAAVTGWVDWAEQHEQQMRTGVLHAAAMSAAVALYGASWAARARGSGRLGRGLGLAGVAVLGGGATIGGHLAFRQGAGANKAEPVPHLVEPGWHDLGRVEEFPLGQGVRRTVGEVPVLVVREAEQSFRVLADRCSHFSGPLSEGEVVDGCVTCPWHGSVFRLADGWNVGGPATAPQPCFATRTSEDGLLQACLPEAG
ncbi:(2Fe-2S)-binding protein [Kitasatospora sp. MMS16-BH015]|uniref:Rieske 2Fe-2S domain-containing protein n=1 Tax=Kitasatospora sp. MMS16-BH015 TaxID=2018025 RepID=UPI000CA24A91|nr:Rieske (2Fe-2S) protein [Kitasatospora sp. MMS16-BH015]AUG81746.1 (2Fe-2S)-binding protein [Kitasatospora sp. MMS16-BH015]